MATVSIAPASGSITAVVTACNVLVAATPDNDATAYNILSVPTEPEIRYYLELTKSGQDALRSHVFAPSADGDHQWNDVIFPAAGTWTLTLRNASTDGSVASGSVVVS